MVTLQSLRHFATVARDLENGRRLSGHNNNALVVVVFLVGGRRAGRRAGASRRVGAGVGAAGVCAGGCRELVLGGLD